MKTLLTGFDETSQQLIFRVYAEIIPEGEGRQKHRTAHFAALDLLGAALAEDFGIIHAKVSRCGTGKPRLLHDNLYMNLSHCRGLAVAAVGRVPLGVDAEAPRAVRPKLMQKVCAPEELAVIAGGGDPAAAFSRFWTLKEAYAKYTGKGIAMDFAELCFSFETDHQIVFHHPASDDVRFWHCCYDEKFSVSLCYPNEDRITVRAAGLPV